jgi:hypothetical protein
VYSNIIEVLYCIHFACVEAVEYSWVYFLQIVGSRPGQADFGGIVGANTLTYLSPALVPNTEYTFRVAAINRFGDGVFSPDMMVQTNFSGVL